MLRILLFLILRILVFLILRILLFLILRILLFFLTWQDFLLGAYEVDDDGAKDETVEEHDGLEASVAEESADDAKDEVERADGGSVRVVGANNFEVVLHHQIVHNSGTW